MADKSIDDLMAHFRAIVDALPGAPVLIGPSFGGLLAEELPGEGFGAGAVAIDPA